MSLIRSFEPGRCGVKIVKLNFAGTGKQIIIPRLHSTLAGRTIMSSELSSESSKIKLLDTDSGLKFLKKAFKSTELLGQWPFAWNESKDTPQLSSTVRRRLSVLLNALVCAAFFAFSFCRLVQLWTENGTQSSAIIYMVLVTVVCTISLIFHAAWGFSGEDMVHSLRLAVPFFQRFEGKLFQFKQISLGCPCSST